MAEYIQVRYTLEQALTICRQPEPQDPTMGNSSTTGSVADYWDLATGYDGALRLASNGWQDTDKADISKLDIKIPQLRQTKIIFSPSYDTAGEYFDQERWNNGDPECMLNWEQETQAGVNLSPRMVQIISNASVSGATNSSKILRRGRYIFALTEALECAGYSVGITLCYPTGSHSSSGSIHDVWVDVKAPSQYLDPSVLAFWLIHPASLRRIGFRLEEHETAEIRAKYHYHTSAGYGYAVDIPEAHRPANSIYFGTLGHRPYELTEEELLEALGAKLPGVQY